MSWSTPKTNWDTHPKAIEPADMNRIEGNIEVVREQNNLPLRAQIVTSLPSPGIPGRLVFNNADKRFYFDTGTAWQVQSAPNLGQVILTPEFSNVPIPEGYHDGTGYVKAMGSIIQSIQTGTWDDRIYKDSPVAYININQVNLNSSIVLCDFEYGRVGYNTTFRILGATFDSSTKIAVHMDITGVSTTGSYIFTWRVIEFNPDIVKSVQRGFTSVSAGSYSDVSINPVNVAKTIPIVKCFGFRDEPNEFLGVSSRLTSSTNLRIESEEGSFNDFPWQIIEFY